MQAQPAIAHQRWLATPIALGMIAFLVSETFLFGSLFIIYYYLRGSSMGHWPPEGVELHLALSTTNTVVLLASSLAVYLAIRAIRRSNAAGLAAWLTVAVVLGTAFLGIKLYEWSTNTFGPWDHAYGSVYYTLTGFHGLHVLAGIGILLALVARARRGLFTAERRLAVEVGGLYWHFVDAVWLAVFSTIFLIR